MLKKRKSCFYNPLWILALNSWKSPKIMLPTQLPYQNGRQQRQIYIRNTTMYEHQISKMGTQPFDLPLKSKNIINF